MCLKRISVLNIRSESGVKYHVYSNAKNYSYQSYIIYYVEQKETRISGFLIFIFLGMCYVFAIALNI